MLRQQLKRLENCAQRDDGSLDMKSQLVAIVAAVLLVGCGESQEPSTPEVKLAEPIAELPVQQSTQPEAQPAEAVAEVQPKQ